MKLSCQRAQSLIALADGDALDEGSRAELFNHAGECRDCSDEIEFQSELREALDAVPMSSPPTIYFDGVLEEIHRRMLVIVPTAQKGGRWRLQRDSSSSIVMASLLLLWIGSAATHYLPRGFAEHRSRAGVPHRASTSLASTAPVVTRPSMVLVRVQGIGPLMIDPELLKPPTVLLRELNLVLEASQFSIISWGVKG